MLTRIIRSGAFAATLLVLATGSFAAVASDIDNYRLTVAGLDRYERATEALYQFAADHPELAGQMEDDGEEEDADVRAMTQRLDTRVPGLRTAVEKSGMKLEEYFTFGMVMAANALGAAVADQFGGADESSLSAVQRANMQFVREHMKRFEEFGARLQEKFPSVGDDGEYSDEEYGDDYSDEYEDQ